MGQQEGTLTNTKPTATKKRPEEAQVPKSKTKAVEMTVPVLEHGSVLLSRVEHCRLSPRQSKALRLLYDGLVAEGESIRTVGEHQEKVTGQNDGVRWLLDQIADAAGLA